MAILTLDEVKSGLHVDWNDEDSDIADLITGAELYLYNATDIKYDNTNALAKLYCKILTKDWYDNRELVQETRISEKVRFTLQSIMLQLQYSGGTTS